MTEQERKLEAAIREVQQTIDDMSPSVISLIESLSDAKDAPTIADLKAKVSKARSESQTLVHTLAALEGRLQ